MDDERVSTTAATQASRCAKSRAAGSRCPARGCNWTSPESAASCATSNRDVQPRLCMPWATVHADGPHRRPAGAAPLRAAHGMHCWLPTDDVGDEGGPVAPVGGHRAPCCPQVGHLLGGGGDIRHLRLHIFHAAQAAQRAPRLLRLAARQQRVGRVGPARRGGSGRGWGVGGGNRPGPAALGKLPALRLISWLLSGMQRARTTSTARHTLLKALPFHR